MDDLLAFLRARLKIDEALAHTHPDAKWPRALREVEAKRRRLARHHPVQATDVPGLVQCAVTAELWPCADLRDDLSIYSDHPDYRQDWA